jgi:hypothetical protein
MVTPLKIPVALIGFNRPDHLRAVLESLAAVRPAFLFVILDGPRSDREAEAARCLAVRRVFEEIKWSCQIEWNCAPSNLGCKMRIVTGLDWLFGQVDEAIILEDDCVPAPQFFRFAEELLANYRNDPRVGMIAGSNVGGFAASDGASYWFSRVPACWGWATWARAWKNFDVTMAQWPAFRREGRVSEVFDERIKSDYWTGLLDGTFHNRIDTWDYPWALTLWVAGQLTVVPSSNLVSNIGFGNDSTHTASSSHAAARRAFDPISFPLRHPTCFLPDRRCEARTHEISHGSDVSILMRRWKSALGRLLRLRFLKAERSEPCIGGKPSGPFPNAQGDGTSGAINSFPIRVTRKSKVAS